MGKQYSDVNGLPSAAYRDYILSYADIFDHYVIYQSGQYEYTGYIWDALGHSTLITIARDGEGTGYNYRWRTEIDFDVDHSYTIVEPMYAYSTERGDGQYFMPQNCQATSAVAQLILTVTVAFVLVFRGLFLRRR